MKKGLVSLAALALLLTLGLWLLFHTNDFWLDLIGASLPTIGLFLYVILDHLWTEEQHNESLWLRLIEAIDYLHWKWKGADLKTKKLQLAACLLVVLFISGIAQFCKARKETNDAVLTREELTNANSIASKSLIVATNSDNDLRILQSNLVSKMEGDRQVLLAMATNCPASPIVSVALDQLRRPIVVAGASPRVKAWADEAMSLADVKRVEDAAAAAARRQQEIQTFQPDYDLYVASIQLLIDTLTTSVARTGDVVTATGTRLPPVESIVGSNYHCHMTTIVVASPPALTYSCDVDRGSTDDPPYLRIRSELPGDTVDVTLQRWRGDSGRTAFSYSGYNRHVNVPLSQLQAAIETNIHRLVGYTSKKSGYLDK